MDSVLPEHFAEIQPGMREKYDEFMNRITALWDEYAGTDDSSLVERHGGKVVCVETSRDNIKVTIPEDLAVAAATLEQRLVEEGCGRRPGRDVQ